MKYSLPPEGIKSNIHEDSHNGIFVLWWRFYWI
jgi:hypothetical protein